MPRIGPLTFDTSTGWYHSQPVGIAALGIVGRFVLTDDHDGDDEIAALDDAVAGFLNADDGALRDASVDLFAYYRDAVRQARELGLDAELPTIQDEHSVWLFVRFGDEFFVELDGLPDCKAYVSIECECDWEPEHGLQLVFAGGRAISKLGPYDGHLTNASAYNRDEFNGVVYVSPFTL